MLDKLYPWLRPILFRLPPETAHAFVLSLLANLPKFCFPARSACLVQCMGLRFKNPVGLAAGFDKDGAYLQGLTRLGFGFIEIGTLTPRAQAGNQKPRLFRLPAKQALINRMGFNNQGIQAAMVHLQDYKNFRKHSLEPTQIGVNIGKNKDTALSDAVQDYQYGLAAAYPYADYLTVNVSSPNTEGLRQFQQGEWLDRLLQGIKIARLECMNRYGKRLPVVMKIAPDLPQKQAFHLVDKLLEAEWDALIISNTRGGTATAFGPAGLSGAPLADESTALLAAVSAYVKGELPLIGVGGIVTGQTVQAKRQAGASLVQLYTGLVYRGPVLIQEAIEAYW